MSEILLKDACAIASKIAMEMPRLIQPSMTDKAVVMLYEAYLAKCASDSQRANEITRLTAVNEALKGEVERLKEKLREGADIAIETETGEEKVYMPWANYVAARDKAAKYREALERIASVTNQCGKRVAIMIAREALALGEGV